VSGPVDHPAHYTAHPRGIECIDVVRTLRFTLGSALKYLWRFDLKGRALEDLQKAQWYVRDELALRQRMAFRVVPRPLPEVAGIDRRARNLDGVEVSCRDITAAMPGAVGLAFALIWDAEFAFADTERLVRADRLIGDEIAARGQRE